MVHLDPLFQHSVQGPTPKLQEEPSANGLGGLRAIAWFDGRILRGTNTKEARRLTSILRDPQVRQGGEQHSTTAPWELVEYRHPTSQVTTCDF